MLKKCLKSLFIISLSFSVTISIMPLQTKAYQKSELLDENLYEVEERLTIEKLNNDEQEVIKEAVDISKIDGESAADIINEFADNDEETFVVAVKEILNTYYENDEISDTLEDFIDNIDDAASEMLECYQEAYEERVDEENLDYAAKEIVVTLKEGVQKELIDELVENLSESYEVIMEDEFEIDEDLNERRKERLIDFQENYQAKTSIVVETGLDQSTDRAISQFKEYEFVETAEKNYNMEVDGVSTNDPQLSNQWYLNKIKTEEAWSSVSTAGTYDIWVAVLDTGLDLTQNDLQGRYLTDSSVDVTKVNSDGSYKRLSELSKTYDSSHGTLTAGVIAAKRNNKIGIAGIATGYDNRACRVMAVKVSDGVNTEGKEIISDADIAKGIKHAVNKGAEVINISISSTYASPLLKEAVDYAEAAGVVVVASAGNYNNNIMRYPAAFSSVICVSATTSSNAKSSFSCYGDWINMAAPGSGIVTTDLKNKYPSVNGTSFSAPITAAAAGLMFCVNPSLKPQQIRSFLYNTATNIGSASIFGKGLLNAGFAVERAKYEEFKNSKIKLSSLSSPSKGKIKINWSTINVYGPEEIRVYRATSKTGTYSLIKTITDGTATTYTDSGLTAGKTYYYKVRAAMKYNGGNKYTDYSGILSCKVAK